MTRSAITWTSLLKISFGALVLSGCKTMSQEECQSASWEVIGYEDGVVGKPSSYLEQHQNTCNKFKIKPDLQAYLQGHAKGLNRYCTYESGMHVARQGNQYNSVCSANVFREFKRGFEQGKHISSLADRIQQTRIKVGAQSERLVEIDSQTTLKLQQLAEETTVTKQSKLIQAEIDKLKAEKLRLSRELPHLKHQLAELEKQYDNLEQSK